MSFEYLFCLSFISLALHIIVLFFSVSFVYVWEGGEGIGKGARMEKDQDMRRS